MEIILGNIIKLPRKTLQLTCDCCIPFLSRRGSFYWREIRKRRRSTPFSNDFQLYFGSQWWVLRRKVVGNLICHYKLQELLKYARNEHIHASEEWIIQSIVGNLGGFNLNSENLHYINWDNVQDWHPNVLNMNYLSSIINSDRLFARKFIDSESAIILQYLDQRIHENYAK